MWPRWLNNAPADVILRSSDHYLQDAKIPVGLENECPTEDS